MACGGWVKDMDKREHKHWLEVGRGILITKSGISPSIQYEMEAWHQGLVAHPPLSTCGRCICVPGGPLNCVPCRCNPRRRGRAPCGSCLCPFSPAGCAYCVTWKGELERLHLGAKHKINWSNCNWRDWWREPWEVAKIFMPHLGARKGDVKDARSTDLGGLMSLLEWCPFIAPPVNRAVVSNVREKVRNLWAHAPNHELSNIEKTAAEANLRDLLNDPVFARDRVAQNAAKELTELFTDGLAIVRDTELKMVTELRNALAVDLVALEEAQKLNAEKVEKVQDNVKGIFRDVNRLNITSQQGDDKIQSLRREIQDLNSFISSYDDRVEKVELKLNKYHEKLGDFGSTIDLLKEQHESDRDSHKRFIYYTSSDPNFADVVVSELRDAIIVGNIDSVKNLIAEGTNINAVDTEGQSPLHWAVQCGQLDICRVLLENNSIIDRENKDGCTPLHEAAKHGHSEITDLLVTKYKANVNAQDNEHKYSPLHWAAQQGHTIVASVLVAVRSDLESQDNEGNTPLHQAARNGHTEIVGTLIANKANTMALEKDKFTPLHWAAYNGHTATAKLLLESGSRLESQDQWERTPMHWAASRGRSETVDLLIREGADVQATDNSGYTPLHWAAQEGFIEATVVLIVNQSSTGSRDKMGNSPLHRAASKGKTETTSVLIDSGADKEAVGENNYTPLHWAVEEGQNGVVQQLLECGVNVETRNIWNNTPLHTAARNGNSEIAALLLSNKADVTAVTDEERTALHLAAEEGEEGHIRVAVELLGHGADLECRIKDKHETPLLRAVMKGKSEMVELLIGAGADVTAADDCKYTPIHWAAQEGFTEIAEVLLMYLNDIDCRDKWNYTPLHRAARSGHQQIAKLLLTKGACINADNEKYCETPLDLAKIQNTKKWLISYERKVVRHSMKV